MGAVSAFASDGLSTFSIRGYVSAGVKVGEGLDCDVVVYVEIFCQSRGHLCTVLLN